MSDTIHHGIVGVTGRGTTHIDTVAGFDDVELVAGSDVVSEYAVEFEAEHGAAGYTDHGEMLAHEDLDSVSICTPNGTHADIAIDCMDAGVDVLVEKPMDVYLDRVDAMVETADEYDRKLACIFQRRFEPERWTLRQWVEAGRFGDMILADTTVKWYRSDEYYDDGWHGTRDLDGGVLLQQAVHFVDMIQWLMGGVERVSAQLETLSHDMECEDTAVVTLEFENGAVGCIEATTSVNGGQDRLELNGTGGSYNSGTFVVDGEEVEPELTEPPCGTGTTGQMRDFFDAIHEDRAPIVDGAEARKSVELVMAAYASSSLERPVRTDEVRDLEEHT
jgi:UDP-N-acetyl-2-amino-2-deoxyglucuronate dehydrogenase